jgi:hypothetical protein
MRPRDGPLSSFTLFEAVAMNGSPLRLGDVVDDYCPRCRLLLNHAVASMVENQAAKVICQTCLSEHAFLRGKEPQKRKPGAGRETLFDQVLAKVSPAVEDDLPQGPKRKPAAAARTISRLKGKPPKSKG